MLNSEQVEELMCLIAAMDRPTLVRHLQEFRGSFPVDLTPRFLQTTDLDRLRHIYVAICLQSRQMPSFRVAVAA